MIERAYIEITDLCNLSCSFCPGGGLRGRFMSVSEFELIAGKLRRYTDCLCLHVTGEPTLHMQLDRILAAAGRLSYRVILTTNGTLLGQKGDLLLAHRCLYKVQISLQSYEANGKSGEEYLSSCADFAARASARGVITVLRLWNEDGRLPGCNSENSAILSFLKERLPGFWSANKRGFCISPKLYLEYGERFVWPDEKGAVLRTGGRCHALTRQIAVLSDGTVVPCCLDARGVMALGNLLYEEFDDIMKKPLPCAMKEGFEKGSAFAHPFCATCGYADRFNQNDGNRI